MTVKITKPQATLLSELVAAGPQGVFKATNHTPAEMLVRDGLAKWQQKYFGGTGKLVATQAGIDFLRGRSFGDG